MNPRMASNVKFKLNVLPDGTPKNFEIVGEGLDEAVKRCLIGSIATLVFPSSATRKELQIVHAYSFTPGRPVQQQAALKKSVNVDFTKKPPANVVRPPVQTNAGPMPTTKRNDYGGAGD